MTKAATVSLLLYRNNVPGVLKLPAFKLLIKVLKHDDHHDFSINSLLALLAFYKNQSGAHRDKDINAKDRDVQKAEPLKSLLVL